MQYPNTQHSGGAGRTRALTTIALGAAIICALGPMSLPLPAGWVPISLGSLGILLVAYLLGPVRGALAAVVYLWLGLIGLPVFAGFSAGADKLAGPTGGYLIGYLPCAFAAGWCAWRWPHSRMMAVAGMALGSLLLYGLGTLWLAYAAHLSLDAALAAGVLPFLPGDAAKIAVVIGIAPRLRGALAQAGML